jgi:hypothetical protein
LKWRPGNADGIWVAFPGGFIAEKFLSNVQPTAQILLDEMGQLCSRFA